MTDPAPELEGDILDSEILFEFLDESLDGLSDVAQRFVVLESSPDDDASIREIFRCVHSIKGNSAFFGLMRVKQLAHELEDVLALVRDGKIPVQSAVIDCLLEGTDTLRGMLTRVRDQGPELPREEELDFVALQERLRAVTEAPAQLTADRWREVAAAVKRVSDLGPGREASELGEAIANLTATVGNIANGSSPTPKASNKPQPRPISATSPPQTQRAAADSESASATRTIRVKESKIDEFLDYVGELIIVREMFTTVGTSLRQTVTSNEVTSAFQRAIKAFTALSHDLQHSIMEIRKVPVRSILQKVPRIVRDLAASIGKEAKVELAGNEISVDKSLVEAFEAPLTHMVRNAVDHGLETPEQREARGKPRHGRIRISVQTVADEVLFEISDDGGGINDDALRAKAVRLGLVSERAASQMAAEDTFEFLFAAGLSTAKAVTDVSGRGVGMDVVKRNVTDLGGRIQVSSVRGQGTVFRAFLPTAVTVQILDGFVFRAGAERFILPLASVHESFRAGADTLHQLNGGGECIRHGEGLLPMVRLGRVLGLTTTQPELSNAIIVRVQDPEVGALGLLVDEVVGVQQVVLRSIDGIDMTNAPFAGGAILGDGRIAMVLDVENLARCLNATTQPSTLPPTSTAA